MKTDLDYMAGLEIRTLGHHCEILARYGHGLPTKSGVGFADKGAASAALQRARDGLERTIAENPEVEIAFKLAPLGERIKPWPVAP